MPNPSERSNRVFSLPELARAAEVSPRTVRYYIAEGLLPPPQLAGPTTTYGPGHLDRLKLIGRLKAAYLPLKEIRRRLAGLGDDEVRALLAEDAAPTPPTGAAPGDAAAYLDRVLGPSGAASVDQRGRSAPREPPASRLDSAPSFARSEAVFLAEPLAAMADPSAPETENRAPVADIAALLDVARLGERTTPVADTGAWRRIALGDDAELLIREEAYRRKREYVEWLVGWARRVFG